MKEIHHRIALIIAVVTFIFGDLITTYTGLLFFSNTIIEQNNIPSMIIESFGIWSLIPIKIGYFGLTYLIYKIVSKPYNIGVMIGLGIIGSYATIHNLILLIKVYGG